jgi:hypothetical protein
MQLATVIFHNIRKPELNKIAMGFFFHRLIILGRGVTDLDKQAIDAQTVMSETMSGSLTGQMDLTGRVPKTPFHLML